MITIVPMKRLYEQTDREHVIFPCQIYLHGELESVCGYDLIDYITCDIKEYVKSVMLNGHEWRYLYSRDVVVMPCKVEGCDKKTFICFKTYTYKCKEGTDYTTRGLVVVEEDISDGIKFASR